VGILVGENNKKKQGRLAVGGFATTKRNSVKFRSPEESSC